MRKTLIIYRYCFTLKVVLLFNQSLDPDNCYIINHKSSEWRCSEMEGFNERPFAAVHGGVECVFDSSSNTEWV